MSVLPLVKTTGLNVVELINLSGLHLTAVIQAHNEFVKKENQQQRSRFGNRPTSSNISPEAARKRKTVLADQRKRVQERRAQRGDGHQ